MNQKSSMLHLDTQYWLYLIGRMKPGAQPAQVQAQLNTELRQWLLTIQDKLEPSARNKIATQYIKLGPGGAGIVSLRNQYQAGLYMLIAASALVLLIACANLANLLLARGAARRQQTAVLLALGATRRRLIRSLLTESILLACIGGAAGLALAYWGTRAILLVAFRGASFVPINTSPSLSILGFTFGLSLLTGIIFGVAPAWIASHSDPAEALRGANRSTSDRSAMPQKTLVIAQAAFVAGAAGHGWPGHPKSAQSGALSFRLRNQWTAYGSDQSSNSRLHTGALARALPANPRASGRNSRRAQRQLFHVQPAGRRQLER